METEMWDIQQDTKNQMNQFQVMHASREYSRTVSLFSACTTKIGRGGGLHVKESGMSFAHLLAVPRLVSDKTVSNKYPDET